MRIVIFGATGQTGSAVAAEALERGHEVSAFVRSPGKLGRLATQIRVLEGDVVDAGAVERAVFGHDAVISTLGVSVPLKADANVVAGVRHILAAMAQSGVSRLIYQSFIGVRESRHAVGPVLRYVAPLALRHEIADHETKEALVRASGTAWTIVRPPKLTNGPKTGRYRAGEDIHTWVPIPMLSRADVAEFIVRAVEQPTLARKVIRLLH